MNKNTQIQHDCDKLWQEIQMILWRGRCAKCVQEGMIIEGAGNLAGHHIISKGSAPIDIRHDILDGILFCWPHHQKAEKMPTAFHSWLSIHHPDRWDFWRKNKNKTSTGTILPSRYQEIYDDLLLGRNALNSLLLKFGNAKQQTKCAQGVASLDTGEVILKTIHFEENDADWGYIEDALGNTVAGPWHKQQEVYHEEG